jgi:NTP pyrophosphatase (non-canonical NTP hydrolase)
MKSEHVWPGSINLLGDRVRAWREDRGFASVESLDTEEERDAMLGKLMLIVTEVAEAAEAVRHNDLANFREEVADTYIRLSDIVGTLHIDMEGEIARKMAYNATRPVRHGKACSL